MPSLRESVSNLLQSEFYRNILSLFSGMFLARIFPAVFALLIVRIYSPENFGIFVLYLTIASALSIVATGKFENAVILADSTEEKKNIFWLSQKINGLVNLAAAVIISGYILFTGIQEKSIILMLLLIPVFSFFFASIQLIRNIFISNKNFKTLSWLEIIRAFTTGVFQCLFFIFPETGLFLGAVLAQLFVFFWYSQKLPETSRPENLWFTTGELKLARRYINFPRFSVASEIFNFLSSQLPVFLIKPFFGETMLGLYSFPHRYVSTPVQLLSTSISRVYIQKARSLKNDPGELGEVTLLLFKRQFLAGIIPFAVLSLWGEPLFRFFFGAEWQFSGFLAQLIAPWLFTVMLISPLSSIMIVMEKQKLSMIFNVLLLISRALSLLAGGLIFRDISWAIGLYSLTGFLFFTGLGAYLLKLAGVNLLHVTMFVFKMLILILLPLILLKIWI